MNEVVPFRAAPLSAETRLQEIARSLQPATPAEFDAALRPAFELHGMPLRWRAMLPIHVKLTDALPADILADAVWQALATIKWFPKPSELLELARPMMEARLQQRRGLVEAMVPGAELHPSSDWPAWLERQRRIESLL